MSMKAHRGIAVPPGISNGYLATGESTERNGGQSRKDLLRHVNTFTVLAPLAPYLRRDVLTSRAGGIQAGWQDGGSYPMCRMGG